MYVNGSYMDGYCHSQHILQLSVYMSITISISGNTFSGYYVIALIPLKNVQVIHPFSDASLHFYKPLAPVQIV